jgi:hypothetical protein
MYVKYVMFMCVYVYICMYVCMYVCVCVYVCMYVCTYVRTYVYICMYVFSMENWQREWETTNKGGITKEYFPKVAERLHTKINLTQNFTTIVTGPREHKILPSQIQNNRHPTLPMRKRESNNGPHITRMRNTTRRQRTSNSRSSKNR